MANIPLPSSVRIRRVEWRLDRPGQANVSAWTGKRTVVSNPWHGKWSAQVELAPIIGEANVRAWRATLAKLKGVINTLQLPATEGPQHAGGSPGIAANAAQGATSLTLTAGSTYGPELVSNGTFDSATTGWAFGAGCSGEISSQRLVLTCTTASSTAQSATQTITGLTIGQTYQITVGFMAASNGNFARFRLVGQSATKDLSTGSSQTITFTATATSAVLELAIATASAWNSVLGATATFDNVSIKQVTATAVPPLTAGMLTTVVLPSGNAQLLMLTADVAANAISFEPPLREAVTTSNTIETANPYAQVALSDSQFGWSVDPGTLYNLGFAVEEAF